MELRPGTSVADHVRLVRPLRAGAMGQVWVAEHLTLQRKVAVKFMSTRLADDDGSARERFIREAATAAQIDSPHVVQTHDQGFMSDGTPYIVMELLTGESLAERLHRDGWLSLPETGQIVLHVGRALTSAHKIGIVHRDIKPENLFLCQGDEGVRVKVLDFGIAQRAELPSTDWDKAGTMAGTPQYLSPELFHGQEDPEGHADLWALGVVAYRCLTGRLPFSGDSLGLLSLSVLSGEHARPSSLRRDLPAAVDGWFARVFARDKRARFHTAKEMVLALLSLVPAAEQRLDDDWMMSTLRGGPAPTVGADTFTPTGLPTARWKRPAIGGALVALALGLVAVLALALRGPGSGPAASGPAPLPDTTRLEAQSAQPPGSTAPAEGDSPRELRATDAAGSGGAGGADRASSLQSRGARGAPSRPGHPAGRPPSPTAPRPVPGKEDYGF